MLIKPVTKKQLLEEILTFLNLVLASELGVSKTTLRLDDLLGLIGLRKAVMLIFKIYDSRKIHIKIIKRKRHVGDIQKKLSASF